MDFLDASIIRQGGALMYPLLLLSLVGFIIFIERVLYLHKRHIGSTQFLDGIRNLVQKRRIIEALTLCEESPGPVSNLVKSGILRAGQDVNEIRNAIRWAAIVEIPLLERRIGSLAATGKIAPLIGFLGTLVAALQALSGLESAAGQSAFFTGQLAAALITSVAGVGIAVMALLGYHFLHGRVRALVHELEWVGQQLENLLTEKKLAGDELTTQLPEAVNEDEHGK